MSLTPVEFRVVANHWRLAGPFSAVIPRAAALGCDEGVNLDPMDVTVSAVVQGVMVNVGWDEHGISGLYRILLSVAEQSAGAFYDIDLVLPLVDVV